MAGPVPRRAILAGGAALALGGWAAPDLEAVLDAALADRSTAVLVARDGEALAQRYAPGWGPDRPREVASVAKSMVALLIGMAVEDGALAGLDQPAADVIPAWRGDARRGVTLRHLMSMTSGLDDAGLALREIAGDQFALNAAAPLRDPPGTRWAYNTAAYHLLFHILARATGETVEAYAERRLLGPLGMTRTAWLTGRGRGAAGPTVNYYSALSTAPDLARLGCLVLNGGEWSGRRLIGAEMLAEILSPSQTLNPSYGLLWWLNARPGHDATGRVAGHRFPRSPRDTVAALGAGGQALMVIPSRRLIVLRQGDTPRAADLIDALTSGAVVALEG